MKICTSVILIFVVTATSLPAGIPSKGAAYHGGTTKDRDFPGIKKEVVGVLDTSDPEALVFTYRLEKKKELTYAIPYQHIIDIEYGQKAGRRVGASIATALLASPVGLFMLFSKKRKHFVTIGYHEDGVEQVAVFELGKDTVRTALPILKARSGKEITYQDEEARKAGAN